MENDLNINDTASKGFETAGDSYERGRPDFPAESVNYLIDVLGINRQTKVVDLGAGTGKFTRLLVPTGAQLIAVEPVDGMIKKFSSILPDVEILKGTAEAIPISDGLIDAVVSAQAFHWFDGEAALKEIHRIFKENGKIGLSGTNQ